MRLQLLLPRIPQQNKPIRLIEVFEKAVQRAAFLYSDSLPFILGTAEICPAVNPS
jgi:hypothetical protein